MAQKQSYCNIQSVDAYANDQGQASWLALSPESKTAIIFYATNDLLAYHGQPSRHGQLWAINELREAAIYRSLFLARVSHLRDTKEAAKYLNIYSDGITTFKDDNSEGLDNLTRSMIDQVLAASGIEGDEYARG